MNNPVEQNVQWNIAKWNEMYNWPESGEEWSKSWGDSRNQWYMTIYPRIMSCLPARTILEVAPGWGRWTRFLMTECSNYIGFDISEKAIRECERRFCFDGKARFFQNDGKTLAAATDGSVDFIFSMDSLVHAETDAMEPYISEFSRVLSPRGVGFVHHSNMAEHRMSHIPNPHLRATSLSADVFRSLCEKYNMVCITQEKLNWGQAETNDCFTLFTRSEKMKGKLTKVWNNQQFHLEINHARTVFEAFRFEV